MTEPLSVGAILPPLEIAVVTQAQIDAYVDVSGDDNPLHADPAIAARAGLAAIPLPGMLVMAQLANWLMASPFCAGIEKLSARFTSPVLVGGDLRLEGRVVALDAGNIAVMRLFARQAGKIAVMGEARFFIAA